MLNTSAIRGQIPDRDEIKTSNSENEEKNIAGSASIMDSVPNEIIQTIFSNLEPEDLATCSKVCKRWHELANNDSLWKRFIEDKDFDFSGKNVKEYIKEKRPTPDAIFCRSLDEALSIMENFFLKQHQVGQKRKFRVMFPPGDGKIIMDDVIPDTPYSRPLSDKKPDITKTCFLIRSKIKDPVHRNFGHNYMIELADNRRLNGKRKCEYLLHKSEEAKINRVCNKFF